MNNGLSLNHISHRSRERIKSLGEVFTPDSYVEGMLNLLGKEKPEFWASEENVFFEPSCGHGNIVIHIYKKRLAAIYDKAVSNQVHEAAFYTVANAINTLWAIDIDNKNITYCRTRILVTTFDFLKDKLSIEQIPIIGKKQKFIAHLLCAINWHIYENEALSALSEENTAKMNAAKTKSGGKWFLQNGHNPIDFNLSWVKYFKECDTENSIPLIYERAVHFVKNIICGNSKGFNDFEFAKYLFEYTAPTLRKNKDIAQ